MVVLGPRVRWLFAFALLGAGGLPGCVIVQPVVSNPLPNVTRVAVAPFQNQSTEAAADVLLVTEAYFSELQQVPGFEVVPVGVTARKIEELGLKLHSPRDALQLARVLGVDAVVIGSITMYDPYDPPRLGLHVEWYSPHEPVFSPGVPVDPDCEDLPAGAQPVFGGAMCGPDGLPLENCEADEAGRGYVVRGQSPGSRSPRPRIYGPRLIAPLTTNTPAEDVERPNVVWLDAEHFVDGLAESARPAAEITGVDFEEPRSAPAEIAGLEFEELKPPPAEIVGVEFTTNRPPPAAVRTGVARVAANTVPGTTESPYYTLADVLRANPLSEGSTGDVPKLDIPLVTQLPAIDVPPGAPPSETPAAAAAEPVEEPTAESTPEPPVAPPVEPEPPTPQPRSPPPTNDPRPAAPTSEPTESAPAEDEGSEAVPLPIPIGDEYAPLPDLRSPNPTDTAGTREPRPPFGPAPQDSEFAPPPETPSAPRVPPRTIFEIDPQPTGPAMPPASVPPLPGGHASPRLGPSPATVIGPGPTFAPAPTRPPFNPNEPIMAYTRIFDGRDAELLARLRTYYELNGDERAGNWRGYLQRSDDFVRFCSHVMIAEMLTLHGGETKRRYVWKLGRRTR